MKRLFISILLASICTLCSVKAQDTGHFSEIVKELSSAKYQGRGYARDGVIKAGAYIEKEFRDAGVNAVSLQPFTIDINTFPGAMKMSVDGKKLQPGLDFMMREYSPGAHGSYKLYHIDTLNYDSARIFADLDKPENKEAYVVCDFWFTYRHREDFARLQSGKCPNAGLIYTWDTPLKFYKAYGEKVIDKPVIWVASGLMGNARSVKLDIDNSFLKGYSSNNVIAKVNGCRHDGCYVFTAHYDHLGNLGSRVFFPGANDNASGTAAIITLASYYAENKPEYDMYFIAFSGEDANLRGSTYFVEHPLFPLSQILYLFNLDMIGDNNPVQYCEVSDSGMDGFRIMEAINNEQSLFKALDRGELAANSDHYPFAQKNVPCIMFENEKGDAFQYYHSPLDSWENTYTDSYAPIFRLITSFISKTTTVE